MWIKLKINEGTLKATYEAQPFLSSECLTWTANISATRSTRRSKGSLLNFRTILNTETLIGEDIEPEILAGRLYIPSSSSLELTKDVLAAGCRKTETCNVGRTLPNFTGEGNEIGVGRRSPSSHISIRGALQSHIILVPILARVLRLVIGHKEVASFLSLCVAPDFNVISARPFSFFFPLSFCCLASVGTFRSF